MAIKTKVKSRVQRDGNITRISTHWKRTPSAGEVRTIVRDNKGNIEFDSHGDYRTVFEIKEPIWQQENILPQKHIYDMDLKYVGRYDVFVETKKDGKRTLSRTVIIDNAIIYEVEQISKCSSPYEPSTNEKWVVTGKVE
jgi:hypothetical protein